MCVFCNLSDPVKDEAIASRFLFDFAEGNRTMRAAERAILDLANRVEPDARKRYLSAHKQMVRTRRQWNKIERMREAAR